ncbi:MAG: response regulator transcription factor [Bacteroidota bacterium]
MKDLAITIIDDEEDILELLRYNFEKERMQVATYTSGYDGMAHIRSQRPDCVVCDWMLGDIDGIEICRLIKRDKELEYIPFIMLTARNDEIDVVTALELGADDYVTKPVRIKELICRVKKTLRRQRGLPESLGLTKRSITSVNRRETVAERRCFKNIVIDTEKYKAYLDQSELGLTHSEFKLLHLFVNRPGKVYSRNQIIEKLNGMDYIVTERSIDVQIVGLRKKLGHCKDYLETVRGVGYRLRD